MFESKDFFNILCQRNNLNTIVEYATAGFAEGQKESKTSSLQILNQIVTSLNDKQNKKGNKDTEKQNNMDEDDDEIVHKSDEEEDEDSNPNSIGAQVNCLVDILKNKIETIEEILRPNHDGPKIQGSVTSVQYVPLG